MCSPVFSAQSEALFLRNLWVNRSQCRAEKYEVDFDSLLLELRYALGDKKFVRPSSLTTHRFSHTGEKPVSCYLSIIPTWFWKIANDSVIPIGILKHTCPTCGKSFSVASNLRRHEVNHLLLNLEKKLRICDHYVWTYWNRASQINSDYYTWPPCLYFRQHFLWRNKSDHKWWSSKCIPRWKHKFKCYISTGVGYLWKPPPIPRNVSRYSPRLR
jgi:hypothetical protein